MSAICGIVHFDGKPVDRAHIETMVESSPYRGPDGTGYWIHDNAGFAHLAFYVTPESVREQQPLLSDDGNLVLLADARLDNRAELGSKLGIDRQQLPLLTDPDLLLRSWQKWGSECVLHLLGDFVFAVWDRRSQELFLARDPLGGYSLTWHRSGNAFVFASETTAILDLPFVRPRINEDAVLKTLGYLKHEAHETFFVGIQYLAPASTLTATRNSERVSKYWDIDPTKVIRYTRDDDYTDQFLELLQRAVANRCRSIGPVGISLSGGHDSTLLAAVASMQLSNGTQRGQLKSFSCVFDRFTECDERRYIEPVVARYGIDARYISADGMWTFADLEERGVRRDYLWTNCFRQLPEAIAAATGQSGCRTMLYGMFGDALFCEPSLFAADLIRQGDLASLATLVRHSPGEVHWPKEILKYGVWPLVPERIRGLYRSLRPSRKAGSVPGLSASRVERVQQLTAAEAHSRAAANGPAGSLPPGKRLRHARIFSAYWAQGFAATRAVPYNRSGVERISPYFDQRLVEFVMAIPTEQVSHPGHPRRLQNLAMRRLLPANVSERRDKSVFVPLLREGLRNSELLRQITDNSLIESQGWVDPGWLGGQLESQGAVARDNYRLSVWLHAELWLEAAGEALAGKGRWSSDYYCCGRNNEPGATHPSGSPG